MSVSAENRARIARRQARALGLRMIQRGPVIELCDAEGRVFGGLDAVESYLGERYRAKPPGPPRGRVAAPWVGAVDDYCLYLAAAGHSGLTIEARRKALARISRELNCRPADVSGQQLVDWFGRQTHWQPETRRFYRSAARGFFAWAYKYGRTAEYLPDHLLAVRIPPATARPVPDDAWRHALATRGSAGGADNAARR